MNGVKSEIFQYLSKLSSDAAPIKCACEKYLKYCSIIDSDYSTDKYGNTIAHYEIMHIGHNPCLYWNNYVISLGKGIDSSWPTIFKERTAIKIPEVYENFLMEINGCTLFNLMEDFFMLYGLSPEKYCPANIFYDNKAPKKEYAGWDLETANNELPKNRNFEGFLIGHRDYGNSSG